MVEELLERVLKSVPEEAVIPRSVLEEISMGIILYEVLLEPGFVLEEDEMY